PGQARRLSYFDRHPLLELLLNPPPRDQHQPAFERTERRIVFETGKFPGHNNDPLLHDILRLGIVQAGFDRDAVNQPCIPVEELLPARLVVPILESAEQTAASWNEFVVVHEHGPRGYSLKPADSYNAFSASFRARNKKNSKLLQNVVLGHPLCARNGMEESVESAQPQWRMIGDGQPMADRLLRLQDFVASFLMQPHVHVVLAEDFDQSRATQVAGQFHAQDTTSSRTTWSRIAVGFV